MRRTEGAPPHPVSAANALPPHNGLRLKSVTVAGRANGSPAMATCKFQLTACKSFVAPATVVTPSDHGGNACVGTSVGTAQCGNGTVMMRRQTKGGRSWLPSPFP
ncbi:hypothetical protein GCM10009577_35710 [Streptomyces javensis]